MHLIVNIFTAWHCLCAPYMAS